MKKLPQSKCPCPLCGSDLPKLVNVDQAAELLGLAKKTVYKLAHQRRLRSGKNGGKLVFSINDIRAYRARIEWRETL